MNNIRKIIEERLENEKFQNLNEYSSIHTYGFNEGIDKALEIILNLIPAPRTEQEILKDFELLGYEVIFDGEKELILEHKKTDFGHIKKIHILKRIQQYSKSQFSYGYHLSPLTVTMQEHKLLNELFTIWGWL